MVDADTRTMSGHVVLAAIRLGNFSLLMKFTNTVDANLLLRLGCLQMMINCGIWLLSGSNKACVLLGWLVPLFPSQGMVFRTWSFSKFIPLQVPLYGCWGCVLGFLPAQWACQWHPRCVYLTAISYTVLEMVRLNLAFSHQVQPSCCSIPITLQYLISSVADLISSWTLWCPFFPLIGKECSLVHPGGHSDHPSVPLLPKQYPLFYTSCQASRRSLPWPQLDTRLCAIPLLWLNSFCKESCSLLCP